MMMSKMKYPVVAFLLLILISVAPLTASAPLSAAAAVSNSVKVQSMNVKMIFDGLSLQPPVGQYVFTYNNSTYVPLRFVSYALQKSVNWDARNKKVTVDEPNGSELVLIKEYLMNSKNNELASLKTITINDVKATYVFNGKNVSVPKGQTSYTVSGTLYVPLRFLSESVGKSINWDSKNKTITGNSLTASSENGNEPSTTASPGPTLSPGATDGSSSGTGKVSYESITSDTEAKLNSLRSQSQSALMSIAMEYIAAKDNASKQNIKAKGLQQLSSFTSSFNNIIAAAEQKLSSNGYSTDIIQQYRSTFEAELQAGKELAEGMVD